MNSIQDGVCALEPDRTAVKPGALVSRFFVAVLVVASTFPWPAVARAQESPGWRVSGGGGIGNTAYRGDDAERGSAAGVARLGIERATGAAFGLAVEWIGVGNI